MYKKVLSLLSCLVLLVLVIPQAVLAIEEVKISMELWNRYDSSFKQGMYKQPFNSYFGLARGYFRVEPKFTDNIKGRFNFDMFSAPASEFTDGAGLKIKYAYIDWSEIPLPDSTVTFGLLKNYYGTIYDWEYVTIEKDPADLYKFAASADYGLAWSGYLPAGYGDFALACYNGEGYKKGNDEDADENPALAANLRLIPLAGIELGVSGSYENRRKTTYDEDDADGDGDTEEVLSSNLKELSMTAYMIHLIYGPVDLLAEALNKHDLHAVHTEQVYMIMPVLKLGKLVPIDMDLISRYDWYDPDTTNDSDTGVGIKDVKNTLILGFNYYILKDDQDAPVLWIQFNWQRTTVEDTVFDDSDTDMFRFQLRWKFGTTLASEG